MGAAAKRAVLVTVVAAAAAMAAQVAGGPVLAGGGPGCAPPRDDRFVVHEWGTFTSMAGSDGVALEGLAREEESLPWFVYSRTEVRECPLRSQGWKGLEVPARGVTQKMETPVLYFHSATPRKVRVRVDFVKGLISQWYPVSDLLGPPEAGSDAGPLDMATVDRSFLQWDVDVLPKGAERPADVPVAPKGDPWEFARDVDASWLRTLPRRPPERAGPVESERFLFYRGLGAFPMPLSVTAERGGRFVLRNSNEPIPPAILMQVEGSRGRLVATDAIPACGELAVELPGGESWGPIDDVEEKLRALVAQRLVATGLRDDEAKAMVRTWARSWFRCEGTRVLWIVPRSTTDALLPLEIAPAPDELVRTLVGRLEIITPEVEDEIARALLDRTSKDAGAAKAAAERLDRLGRFLEPHVRNVLARTKDETVRRDAQALLSELAE